MSEYIETRDCDECLQPFWDDPDSVLCPKCLNKKKQPVNIIFMDNIHHSLQSLAIDIDKLSFLEGNPRQGDVEAVAKSYKQFGQRKPIVATKDYVVIAGNHQLAAARQLGWDKIAVVITDDDELTAKAFALADNRTAELGSYDDDLLADLLSEVSSVPELMDSTGFSEDDLFDLIGFDDEPEEEQEIEVPVEPKTNLGDMYKLGNHYLLCGDATELENYKQNFDLLLTDPPYGVDYSNKKEFLNEYDKGNANQTPIINDNLLNDEIELLWDKVFNNCYIKSNKNSSYYIFGANIDNLFFNLQNSIIKNNYLLKHQLVWVKNNFVLNRTDYKYQHEPILYGWKVKEKHNFYGENNNSTVLNFDKPKQSKLHPTMKPIELLQYLIINSTKVNEWVLDPFGGSGSTLIACEQIKRNCYMIELDPAYCDVIIERWENLTGQKAELING